MLQSRGLIAVVTTDFTGMGRIRAVSVIYVHHQEHNAKPLATRLAPIVTGFGTTWETNGFALAPICNGSQLSRFGTD
jgi:hypothetical protein